MTEKAMNLKELLRTNRNRRATLHMRKSQKRAIETGYVYQPTPELAAKVKRHLKTRAFVGVDGEGGGTNERGQQHYRLLRAGTHVLFKDNEPLTTADCLEFLVRLPPRKIYVGFSFGYDTTMILRDLPKERLTKLFGERSKFSNYTYWRDYAIDWLPGHYLRVARIHPYSNRVLAESARTVFETWGFFQSSFVRALETWGIGSKAERDEMAKTKDNRSSFGLMTPELIEYNRQECIWLAELMEVFRERCQRAGLRPHTWNGAGKLACALLREHNVIRAERVVELLPPVVLQAAQYAYYGGRAELAWHGVLPECWAYDRKSSYPSDMLTVPCIEHGVWLEVGPEALAQAHARGDLFLAEVEYRHPKGTVWCSLPHRDTTGRLRFLRWGKGVYWSPEIRAAERIGAEIRWRKGWIYQAQCNCQPLAFVAEVYAQRLALDAIEPGLGTPLKLALNSLYGKFAQRLGEAPWQNHLWSGYITACTRAALLDAIAAAPDPSDIIMLATDAVFSRARLNLENQGQGLGQWEERQDGASFFAKPGIYWQLRGERLKSRGISHNTVRSNREVIEAAWQHWSERIRLPAYWAKGKPFDAPFPYPVLRLHAGGFVGLRLAFAQGNLDRAGSWLTGAEGERKFGFAWGTKRIDFRALRASESPLGLAVLTLPYDGTGARSAHWEPLPDTLLARETDLARWWIEGQPNGADQDDLLMEEAP